MGRVIAPHLTPRVHKQPASGLEHCAASAIRIADRAVLSDIETEGVRVGARSDRTYDVRPMLDERERGAESVDMASEAIAYALVRGLIQQAGEPWLVRVVAKP